VDDLKELPKYFVSSGLVFLKNTFELATTLRVHISRNLISRSISLLKFERMLFHKDRNSNLFHDDQIRFSTFTCLHNITSQLNYQLKLIIENALEDIRKSAGESKDELNTLNYQWEVFTNFKNSQSEAHETRNYTVRRGFA